MLKFSSKKLSPEVDIWSPIPINTNLIRLYRLTQGHDSSVCVIRKTHNTRKIESIHDSSVCHNPCTSLGAFSGLYSCLSCLRMSYYNLVFFHRIDCLAKSRDLQARLMELKTEMEDMRADQHISTLDRLHEENLQRGDNKYSTLQKVLFLSVSLTLS